MKLNGNTSDFTLSGSPMEKTKECPEKNCVETFARKETIENNDSKKMQKIAFHFKEIMKILGLDLEDDSLKDTPKRVAKMYIEEAFSGLDPKNKPEIRLFENKYEYNEMLIQKDISLYSYCEHHFVPIVGKVHVGYFPNGKVIGLSKLNRLVNFFAKRPQVQERLTVQIAEALKEALQSEDVAVIIDAEHFCVASRGIKDTNSNTTTSSYYGRFKELETRQEFISTVRNN